MSESGADRRGLWHWRRAARRLTDEVLRPHEVELPPDGTPPPAVFTACLAGRRAAGLWGITVPAASGGLELPWRARVMVQEEVHGSLLGLWTQQVFTPGEPPSALYDASLTQRTRVLQPCLTGERMAHQLVLPATPLPGRVPGLKATPVRGGARLDGVWPAVPALMTTDLLLVMTELGGTLCGFLCEPGLHGYRVVRRRGSMGSITLTDLAWEACVLDEERLIRGIAGSAARWQAAMRGTVFAAGALGAAVYCLECGLEHLRQRVTFGRPLAERQAMQWMVADSARELQAARLLVQRAAAIADSGEDAGLAAAATAAKVYATDVACAIVDRVLQMHGGYGYTRALPFERYWRELRYYRLAEGNNDQLAAEAGPGLLAQLDG